MMEYSKISQFPQIARVCCWKRGGGRGRDGEGRRVPGVGGGAARRRGCRLRCGAGRRLRLHASLRLQLHQAAPQPPGAPSPHVIQPSPFVVALIWYPQGPSQFFTFVLILELFCFCSFCDLKLNRWPKSYFDRSN